MFIQNKTNSLMWSDGEDFKSFSLDTDDAGANRHKYVGTNIFMLFQIYDFLNLNTKGEVLQHVLVTLFHTWFGDWSFQYHESGAVYLLYS